MPTTSVVEEATRFLTSKGYTSTKAHYIDNNGNGIVSLVNQKEGFLYAYVFENGGIINKSLTKVEINPDGSFNRLSNIGVDSNGKITIE